MRTSRIWILLLSVIGSTLLVVSTLFLFNPAQASAPLLFTAPNGSGSICSQSNPCALQTALNQAVDGDTIYFAQGVYTGTGNAVITLTKSITLSGGWDGSTTTPIVLDPKTYLTTLDGERARRVLFISEAISPTIDGFVITKGNASDMGGGYTDIINHDAGGGIYCKGAAPIIQNNVITNNVGSTIAGTRAFGGGISISSTLPTIIRYNQILSNTAGINIHLGDGGGMFSYGPISVTENTFMDNIGCINCPGQGGGYEVGWTTKSAFIEQNVFKHNEARYGGGVNIVWSAVIFRNNTVINNHSSETGGGLNLYYISGASIDANTIISNSAKMAGGINVNITLATFPSITNNIIAHNSADNEIGGIFAKSDWHKGFITITNNTLFDNQEGIIIGDYLTSTLIKNNIIVSHTVAITTISTGSAIIADHTLFWNNTSDGIRGTNPVDGEPAFVDAANDNYHIQYTSAALDAGTSVDVPRDIDGDSRPSGAAYDIGADEYRCRIYLPLTVKSK